MEKISSVDLLLAEAVRRGIAVTSYTDIRPGFALLTYSGHQEYIFQSQSNHIGRVTARLLNDNKVLTTHLLRSAGFPVPADILIGDTAAAAGFLQTYQRVVIKPVGSDGGKGVTPNITTHKQLTDALEFARPYNQDLTGRCVCQQHVDGRDWRVLVLNYQHVFAMERIPAHVVGNGTATVQKMIDVYNTTARPGYDIIITAQTPALLTEQGLTLESVVPTGITVRLARVANAHAGGTVRDATDEVSDDIRTMAVRVAEHFHCPLIGVDLLAPSLETVDTAMIIELNACPDLTIHHFPDEGTPRDVVSPWLDMVFPETAK